MNPVELARSVEQKYRDYLNTTFYFKDPELRRSFEDALNRGHLSKGPYLEATPVFKRADTTRALFETLTARPLGEPFSQAIDGDRPLYQHQADAIRKVRNGSNVLVATGTGSGKTEAFLYPILLHLYEEFHGGRLCPGVRALILYPMNALANDQRERLGEICKRLEEGQSSFQFTFGQYIGETPENENDSDRHARDHLEHRLPGELVLRSEMRKTPPHILLTNYSMLEFLLLRPDDSPLFDSGQARWWSFFVLDEVHQYRGSRGIEMAMLLRRLKQRLREGGRSDGFRCIATSATLVGGSEGLPAVAQFASLLFGEPFHETDVILGETEPIPEPTERSLDWADYALLHERLAADNWHWSIDIGALAKKLGIALPESNDLARSLGALLQADLRAARLRRVITTQPVDVRAAGEHVFGDLPEAQRVAALSTLVDLLLQAKDPVSGTPLLSARYHFFLRSLEGAFVSYSPHKRVFLERKAEDSGVKAFEVALCRECGQHYLVGRVKGNKLVEAVRDPSQGDFGATFLRPVETDEDEDEGQKGPPKKKQTLRLCVRCGEIAQGTPTCGHHSSIRVVREDPPQDDDRADQIGKCGACGYNAAGRDPVRELLHGADGPNAVIATTLHQNLPERRKKVLAFADGRQEAAFFAWYLEDTYKDIRARNLLLRAAHGLSSFVTEGLSLQELATQLRELFREWNVFPPATGELELHREAWLAVYREFLTDEQRISLEGVGLARWSVKWPGWLGVPEVFMEPPWSLSEPEARDLLSLLLDSMRADRAVELRTGKGISLTWNDLGLRAAQMRLQIGLPKGQKGVRSWDGRNGKRARFLAKLLLRLHGGFQEQEAVELAVDALRAAWEMVRQSDEAAPSSNDRLLLAVDDARRLNPDWWRLRLIPGDEVIKQCETCGRLQATSVGDVCARHRCPGTLKTTNLMNLERNHYRSLYKEALPGSLRVEEHTAQLDKEKAREFQREFREDRIDVLSCSTTFELGVDLGNLDTIFLRNAPPEAFNYAQRVGRAGRRTGHPGFAVTYCRRGPHDLYHFAEPDRMLKGTIRPPVVRLGNEKILIRHMAALGLSAFFRAFPQRFRTVQALFADLAHPSGLSDFRAFLQKRKVLLEESLRRVVPEDMAAQVGLVDGNWIENIAGLNSRFSVAQAEASSDYQAVTALEVAAAAKGDYDTAKWAKARAKTIAEEDVLSFLSRKAVIPKYGFPVDVVELDTQRTQKSQESMQVSLQRDLTIAVAEFAPTSKLVANKKVWSSYGLKRVAEREWERKLYRRCVRHNVFLQWRDGEPELASPCGDHLPVFRYVIPSFGFVTDRDKPGDPTGRPPRVFTTRPYFAGSLGPDGDVLLIPAQSPSISMKKASPGLMVVLCEGRRGEGFYICGKCGAGFRKREKTHRTPQRLDCSGALEQLSLGHEFVTDVLEIQFLPSPTDGTEPVWFAYSIAYALVEGAAEVLEVPSTDLSATVAHSTEFAVPPIVLYDNVPGGAGLVARLQEETILRDCLEAALKRVSGNCGCDDDTSCYGCLRSYRNQFAHQHIKRGPVMRYFERLCREWR